MSCISQPPGFPVSDWKIERNTLVDDIDFGDFVGVSQSDAADFALPQQVIRRVAADAQHGLQILDRYNVRVLRKHELVHFPDFFTIHSITILEF